MKRRHYKLETARRKAKLYWWPDEVFVYSSQIVDELKKANIKIDTVATHSAPDFCQPLTNPKAIGWTRLDRELENDKVMKIMDSISQSIQKLMDDKKLYMHLILLIVVKYIFI